jgi:coenzyme F420-reducing hydrogenase delta subunit
MVNLSSAMGAGFAEMAAEMDAKIRELGPNPLRRKANVNDAVGGEE